LDHIFDFAIALCLTTIAVVLGGALSKWLRLTFANTAERLSFSLFLGTGFIGLVVLFLGLLGLLHIWIVAALAILSLGFGRRLLIEICEATKGGLQAATRSREGRVLTGLFVFLVALFFIRTFTPPAMGDELIYHLSVPQKFAERGRVYPTYENLFGNLPFLIHMIYVLCQMAGSDIAAKLFSLLLAVATGFSLYGFCRRFLTRRIGVISLFGFFAAGMVVEVAVTARIDVSLAGVLFLTTYAMMVYLSSGGRGWLWASAVLAGFSLGIKSSAGPWLAFVGIMYLYETVFTKKERITAVLQHGLAYIFIAAVIASPWYIKNYVWFHNPVYPFFTGEVAEFGAQGIRYFNIDDERKLEAHMAAARKEIPETVNAQENEIREAIAARITRHPMRLWEFFFKPEAYLMWEPFHFPNYLFLLIPLVFFVNPNKWILWLLGLSIAFAMSVTWSSWIARYLLPVYPTLTIVAAYTLVGLSDRVSERIPFLQTLPNWITGISLSIVLLISVVWIKEFQALQFMSGTVSRRDFLLKFPFYPRIDFINTQLPRDTRVLDIGAHMNYGIERDNVPDESWFATKWRRLLVANESLDEVNQSLNKQGFGYILYCSPFVHEAQMGIKGSGGMDLFSPQQYRLSEAEQNLGQEYELLRTWSTFTLYRSKFLETVFTDDSNCEVLKIK
jgi:4-amino-4-deoxy-L-arabinose transferase-like glycosyltransferase